MLDDELFGNVVVFYCNPEVKAHVWHLVARLGIRTEVQVSISAIDIPVVSGHPDCEHEVVARWQVDVRDLRIYQEFSIA